MVTTTDQARKHSGLFAMEIFDRLFVVGHYDIADPKGREGKTATTIMASTIEPLLLTIKVPCPPHLSVN